MEESFPRGGGGGGGGRIDSASAALRTPSAKEQKSSSTSTSTKRKAQQQAQAGADKDDFLFGSRSTSTPGEGGTSGKKKRRKSSATGGDPSGSGSSSMLPLGGGAVLQPTAFDSSNRGKDGGPSKAALIESLSFNKLGKGTRLLGLVRDVAPDYAVVSLPNMLTGFVRRAKATDIALTDVYTPGTMMAFSIVKTTTETVASSRSPGSSSANGNGKAKTETRRRIELTASPQVINADLRLADLDDGDAATTIRGRIVSCEDHGCIVDLGLAGLGRKMAFLRYENVEGGYDAAASDEEDDGDDEDDEEMKDRESESGSDDDEDEDEKMEDAEDSDDDDDENKDGGKKGKKKKGGNDQKSSGAAKFILNAGRIYDFTVKSIPTALLSSSSAAAGAGGAAVVQLGLRKASSLARVATSIIATSASSSSSTGYTVRTLRPGMLLKCHVEHYARNGLCVTFLGNVFRGSIDMANLGGYWSGVGKMDGVKDANLWWKDVFVGKLKTVSARLVAVDPATKIIRLSLLPHVLALSAPLTEEQQNASAAPLPSVGSIIENARVIRHDPGVGALIALPSDSDGDDDMDIDGDGGNSKVFGGSSVAKLLSNDTYRTAAAVKCAYVHISKAMDPPTKEKGRNYRTPEALFAKHFALHAKVPRLRILSTSNLMDNVASCATAESIVASAALSYSDLAPGAKYTSVPIIRSMDGGGILVELGHGIRGLVPANHLFDKAQSSGKDGSSYRSKVRAEKFRVGNKIDVRCLQVDEDARRCVLTAKKTLVQSDPDDPITDYFSIAAGKIATGFISKVDRTGVTVTFYNNVYGKATARRLAEELGVEDPTMNYNVGDVIRARVISCRRYKLDLSLNTSISGDDDQKGPSKTGTKLEPGSILPPKCMKIVQLFDSRLRDDGVSFIPGYAVVTIKAKHLNIKDEGQSVDCKISFDQILDAYDTDATASADGLDKMARQVLKVGKKINQPAIVIFSGKDGTSGKVAMPVVSLRPALVKTVKLIAESEEGTTKVSLPSPETSLYQGAIVQGYCTRLDPRYGAFIRFLNGLTGLIPKLKGGLDVNLFDTVLCRISALDVTSGSRPKILLKRLRSIEGADGGKSKSGGKEVDIKVDEIVGDVRVEDINFARATVTLMGDKYKGAKIRARIHFTMAVQPSTPRMPLKHPRDDDDAGSDGHTDASKTMITTHHPFYKWSSGDILNDVKCFAVENRNSTLHIELAVTDDLSKAKKSSKKSKKKGADAGENNPTPVFVSEASHLPAGTAISGVITRLCSQNRGVWIHVCPGVTGFVSGMELSDDIDVLNNLKQYYKIGGVLNCTVMEKRGRNSDKKKQQESEKAEQVIYASALQFQGRENQSGKPTAGDLVIGRINRNIKPQHAPALMLELRGGFEARCDITELNEMDEWENMPLGRLDASVIGSANNTPHKEKNSQGAIVTDESADDNDSGDDDSIMSEDEEDAVAGGSDYPTGNYVRCRVLSGYKSASTIEVSLRESRLDGDLEDDEAPEPKEMVHAYVINTNKKGCFVRLSRFVEGRVILKELADGFLPDPAAMFPQGRLVIGKVKDIRHQPSDAKKGKKYSAKVMVDLDMRESTLLEDEDKITYDDIKVGEKYKGTVTRVEPYGVFVRLENSEMTGLAHLSECSDNYIKNLTDLYDPGDLVKALVVKKDEEQNRFGLSLKASHFEDDSDSDDDDESTSSSESGSDADGADDLLNDVLVSDAEDSDDAVDSDDENFASKLAAKMKSGNNEEEDDDEEENSSDEESSSSDDDDDDDEDSSSSDDEEEEDDKNLPTAMDTDVGFNWGSKNSSNDASSKGDNGNESSDSDSSDESDGDDDNDEIDNAGKSSHKARKKAAARRKEEKEISARESALADGTADSNPETSADFERLLAADPNASENWIRYMAYHLSLADIDSARNVANRAFDRIEFRQEDEKLNVWTALLTLEFKYGTPKSQQATIDRASQQNNPKKVYLRVCEMLEREVDASASSPDRAQTHDAAVARADELFLKMCKKFKSKKTVWIAYLKYLLKSTRHEEAHALLKRAMQSLPDYKHVETMSKFAQLEFEHGSPERARTIYDTLIEKHPKRLDLLFVYVDKEVKHGELAAARNIFMNVIDPTDDGKKKAKYSDKQMKSLFKKWFRIEEEHGDVDSREEVKAAARDFVERTAAAKS